MYRYLNPWWIDGAPKATKWVPDGSDPPRCAEMHKPRPHATEGIERNRGVDNTLPSSVVQIASGIVRGDTPPVSNRYRPKRRRD